MTNQAQVVLAASIVKSVTDNKNNQKALENVLTVCFPAVTTAYKVDVYDGKEEFPAQVKEVLKALDTMRKGKDKANDLATFRNMAGRWAKKTFEGFRISVKTGTIKSPDTLAIELIENTKDAGSKTNTSKGKEKGKSGTEVKATLESLIASNDWDMQDLFYELAKIHSIKSVKTEMGIFLNPTAKKG